MRGPAGTAFADSPDMATLVGKQSEPVKLLRSLVELDYDAIDAYEAAIDRLDDAQIRTRLEAFCDDHRRHVATLNPIIQRFGGEPVLQGDIKRVLTRGKVVIGGLFGNRAILMAMKTNEEDTNTAYERAVAQVGLGADVTAILQSHLSDERRHREYLVVALQGLAPEPEMRASSPSAI